MYRKKRTNRQAGVKVGKDRELDNCDPWGNQEIRVVDDVENCREVVKQLKSYV